MNKADWPGLPFLELYKGSRQSLSWPSSLQKVSHCLCENAETYHDKFETVGFALENPQQ